MKSGDEYLSDGGKNTPFKLIDFWRWSVSDILSNATRGRFAEFIVGTAIGLDSELVRDEWASYDLKSSEGIKIEVKSSAYVQSWVQKKPSVISFSIKSSRYWNPETGKYEKEKRREAHVYVFCHLKHKDKNTIDPLKLDQWDFYVLPTSTIDNYERSQSSITINSIRRLTQAIDYNSLKKEIQKAYYIHIKSASRK